MKKTLLFLVSVMLITIFTGCSEVIPPENMSPEETVNFYFKQYNKKNQQGMDSVVCANMKGVERDLGDLKYVKLLSYKEETDESKVNFQDAWYPNAYKKAMVNVKFDINYKSGSGGGGHSNGEIEGQYCLVKDNETSDWVIVMWGFY